MSEIELKPCPFCGSKPWLSRDMDEDLWSHNIVEWKQVKCTECECEGIRTCDGFEVDAVTMWNTRFTMATPDGYVLVPLEPTEAMVDKACDIEVGYPTWAGSKDCITDTETKAIYAAMLAARPEVSP
jgi:hypothetical protein